MKILTPEEEAAHNKATWKGGILGGIGGLAVGAIGVFGFGRRIHLIRQLSLPFQAFLVTGTTTFSAVISADRASSTFAKARHADSDYRNQSEREATELEAGKTLRDKAKEFLSEQRYPIVFGSWVASMAIALGLVGRSPHMTGQQKLVQARVYAQGLTLAVLVASFALEGNDLKDGKGRWETIKVLDPDDPEHKRIIEKRIHHERYSGEDQWMDMIDSQEQKLKSKGESTRDSEKKKKREPEKEEKQKPKEDKEEKEDKQERKGNKQSNTKESKT